MSVNKVETNGSLTPIATRGQFIQYSTMPTASVDIVNKIVQYIGATNQNYTNGYFYKCIEQNSTYIWTELNVQDSSAAEEMTKAQYDTLTTEQKNDGTIRFITDVDPISGENIQVTSLPTASSTYENKIYQYIGTTTQDYTNGYFYKCVNNSGTYSWQAIPVEEGLDDWYGISIVNNKIFTDTSFNDVLDVGEASNEDTHSQVISYSSNQINSTINYQKTIDGTMYMETTTTSTPTTGITRFTFTNTVITNNKVYDFYCDVYGVAPKAVTISSNTMYVDFNSSDNVTKCRVYIR